MQKCRYTEVVKFSRKITLCLICLFVFTFKITASDLFVDKGFDRAESISSLQKLDDATSSSASLVKHIKVDSSLNLMSHVVGNLTSQIDANIYLLELKETFNEIGRPLARSLPKESIYKPPKA